MSLRADVATIHNPPQDSRMLWSKMYSRYSYFPYLIFNFICIGCWSVSILIGMESSYEFIVINVAIPISVKNVSDSCHLQLGSGELWRKVITFGTVRGLHGWLDGIHILLERKNIYVLIFFLKSNTHSTLETEKTGYLFLLIDYPAPHPSIKKKSAISDILKGINRIL